MQSPKPFHSLMPRDYKLADEENINISADKIIKK
jgi:hypothetical protein